MKGGEPPQAVFITGLGPVNIDGRRFRLASELEDVSLFVSLERSQEAIEGLRPLDQDSRRLVSEMIVLDFSEVSSEWRLAKAKLNVALGDGTRSDRKRIDALDDDEEA